MSKVIKDYKITGKINKYDVINSNDTSFIIMSVNDLCCILVESNKTIDAIISKIKENKEYEIRGIFKNIDEAFYNNLLCVFKKNILDKYSLDKQIIIIRDIK